MPVAPPERRPLLVSGAVVLGAALIALSVLFTFRWEIAPNSRIASVVRLDRWTGEMMWCFVQDDEQPAKLHCGSK